MLTTGYTPIFQVLKDGVDITSRLQDRLTQVKLTQTQYSQIGDVEFIFDDRDWALELPQVKDTITFLMGYKETGLSVFGDYTIDEVHLVGPPRSIKILGHCVSLDSDLKLRATKTYTNTTAGEIIKDIASQDKITANVESSIGSIKMPTFNQVAQSGFHVIDQLARTYGGVAIYENGTVNVVKRGTPTTVSGAEFGTIDLNPEDFGEWDFWIQSRAAFSGAQAAWFDKDNVTRQVETVRSSGAGLGTFPLIGSVFENPNRFHVLPGMFQSQEQARAAAKAALSFTESLRAMATITLAKGDPTIRVHQGLNIQGMRDGINGQYIVETVTHSYRKTTGIVTNIEAKTPEAGDGA